MAPERFPSDGSASMRPPSSSRLRRCSLRLVRAEGSPSSQVKPTPADHQGDRRISRHAQQMVGCVTRQLRIVEQDSGEQVVIEVFGVDLRRGRRRPDQQDAQNQMQSPWCPVAEILLQVVFPWLVRQPLGRLFRSPQEKVRDEIE